MLLKKGEAVLKPTPRHSAFPSYRVSAQDGASSVDGSRQAKNDFLPRLGIEKHQEDCRNLRDIGGQVRKIQVE